MGAKTFINQTGHNLNVEITVRAGTEVGNAVSVQNIGLSVDYNGNYQYSDDDNPYLDGILVNSVDDATVFGEIYVYAWEDDGDVALNTNNTITFSLQGGGIGIICTNT